MTTRTVITPPGRLHVPDWRELWGARDAMYQFGRRDVVLRYRQTVLGVIWVVIQPIASAGIFAIVFGQVANLPTDGVPYFVFALSGMLIWTVFSGIVTRSAPSLVANQSLVSKVYFPRLLVPVSSALSVLLDFLIALVLLAVVATASGIGPGWPLLLMPVWVLAGVGLATGIGLAASAASVKWRDIAYVLPWLLQTILYASPVAYSINAVPEHLRTLFAINPVTWLLEAFRWSTIGTAQPPLWQLFGIVAAAFASLFVGTIFFGRWERSFADYI